ncbi:MAG: hypothetical protein ACRDFS_11700, partial [Chloroflexota bacterium]
ARRHAEPRPPPGVTMKLFYELEAKGSVLGHEFRDHVVDLPEEIAALVLANPLWREARAEDLPKKPKVKHD